MTDGYPIFVFCSDEGLRQLQTSAQKIFTVFNIPISTFSLYNLLFYSLPQCRSTLVLTGTSIPPDTHLCLTFHAFAFSSENLAVILTCSWWGSFTWLVKHGSTYIPTILTTWMNYFMIFQGKQTLKPDSENDKDVVAMLDELTIEANENLLLSSSNMAAMTSHENDLHVYCFFAWETTEAWKVEFDIITSWSATHHTHKSTVCWT